MARTQKAPPAVALNRDRILRAAVAVADRGGFDSLSMRNLAQELSTAPMSIYRHVANKEDLLDGIVQTILMQVELPPPTVRPWKDRIKYILHSFRQVAHSHPSVVTLLASNPPTTPEGVRPIEAGLEILQEAGYDAEQGAEAYRALASYVIGFVSLELGEFFSAERLAASATTFPIEDFPNLVSAAPYLMAWDPERAFDVGIDLILTGLERRGES